MLLQIDGWFGSGKSVLKTLLDGHPDVFCSLVHEYSFSRLLQCSNKDGWLADKYSIRLRRFLSQTEYYLLEVLHYKKHILLDFSHKDRLSIPFDFDFYEFDRSYFGKLYDLEKWEIEKISVLLYETMFEIFNKTNQGSLQYPKYYASSSDPRNFRFYKNFPVLFPNGKSILIHRKIEDIIATRSRRRSKELHSNIKRFYDQSFVDLIKSKEVENILQFYEINDALRKKHPHMFMKVEFSDLISDTEAVMKEVCKFLNIGYLPVLSKATHKGVELVCNGKKYIGEELDKPDELLSKKEKRIIQYRQFVYEKVKSPAKRLLKNG